MKYLLVLCFVFGELVFKFGRKSTVSTSPQLTIELYTEIFDTSKYAVLKFDETENYLHEKNLKPADILNSEIPEIEELLSKSVNNYNIAEKEIYEKRLKERGKIPAAEIYDPRIRDLSKYRIQLISVTNVKGEKLVWVNCFYSTFGRHNYWKKSIVAVQDGGNWYFNLKINLTLKKVYDFHVNGVA